MKTYVLIAGLIALLPQVDSQGKIISITALILNAEGTALGQEVHPHEPLLVVYENQNGTFKNPLSATLQAETGHIILDDPGERVLDFDRLYPKGGLLREECITGDVQKECLKANGKPVLAGRVTLTGDWIIRPVDIDHLYIPRPGDMDLTTLGFVSYTPPRLSPLEANVAGAVLFETKKSVKLVVAGKEIPVKQIQDCSEYHLGGAPCVFISLNNFPKSGMPFARCGRRHGEVDTHFELIYEIFETTPNYRYVPFNRQEDVEACRRLLAPGPGDYPPRIKCPTPMLSPVAKP